MIELIVDGYGSVRVEEGVTLLDACEAVNIPMESACGGFACCNSCRVAVHVGSDRLSPCQDEERPFLDAPEHRLGCQARLLSGPVSISLAPGA